MDANAASLAASHLLAGKYFQLAAFVMLVYDHILTFDQEVERIWKHRFSAATLLFLLNRYATLMQFIIILVAFHDPSWTGKVSGVEGLAKPLADLHLEVGVPVLFSVNSFTSYSRCSRFVLFEGTTTVGLLAVGQLIMILRVYAIYDRSSRILALLLILCLAQVVISFVGLRNGYAVPLPPGLTGCILTGSADDILFPSVWIAPLITDTTIFLLTIYRTKHYLHHLLSPFMSEAAARAIMILVRDGAMYFFLIFLSNLMNGLIFFLADPDLKAIGASFSQLLTSTMISRLVLNLRSISRDTAAPATMETGEDRIVFNTPSFLDQEESESSAHDVGRRGETLSFWAKAAESLTGGAIYSYQSTHGRSRVTSTVTGAAGIEIATEVIRDIPMQRLDPARRPGAKGYMLV